MQEMEPPSRQLEEDEMLGFTAAFDEETWESTRGALQHFEIAERTHSRYGYVESCPDFVLSSTWRQDQNVPYF